MMNIDEINIMITILVFVNFLLIQVSMQHSINPRISNGKNTYPDQFLFMASVQLIDPPSTIHVHICGGVVLDEYWILSSAICVLKTWGIDTARVKINMYYIDDENSRVQIFKIEERLVPDNFDNSSYVKRNDIGLIKLQTQIIYPVKVKLPQPRNVLKNVIFMIGWGRTSAASTGNIPEILQYAEVSLLKNEECQILIQNFGELKYSHICTNSPRKPITSCQGDSGGPLIHYFNNVAEVIGIISWSLEPCGQVGAPTISTRVSHFNDWIIEKSGKTANKMFGNSSLLTPLLVK